jgi:acyl-CoA synthetase (AMP-forming)/AMP-acid ligase II
MVTGEKKQTKKRTQRKDVGDLVDQPCWSFIKELNSISDERLDSIALTGSYRQYTYRQMFRAWEKYAEAFSGLGLTGKNHSRVGIISVPLPETIFALYGLNMTGASVSLIYHLDLYDEKQIYSMIEREKITDLVISEIFAFPNVMKRLLNDREKLGIKNVIVLPSPMGGEYAMPAFDVVRKLNKAMYSELPDSILMEDLLDEYEAHPISVSKEAGPIILHTTGTVSGMHKPVPMSNKAINSVVVSIMKAREEFDDFKQIPEHPVTTVPFYLSWAYFFIDALHTSLCMGANVVCLPMASMNPHYSEAIEKYEVNVLFTGLVLFDTWNKTRPKMDLSKLKLVIMGGTYISPEYKEDLNTYLRSCNSKAHFINGYGLSELGGACIICPSVRKDDAIGYLMPGFKAKLFVEDENRYYDIADGPRTGVLLLNSPTMSDGKLDGTEFFGLDEVDGEMYFNSHDLVRVDEDCCMTCIGRSNNYFVNNAGVRFDAGLVETAMTKQPGVRFCGLAPEFHKVLHDNIPILYVEMKEHGVDELAILRNALIQVFIKDELISDTNLPSQCVLVDHMPLNSNGKVDGKLLKSGTVTGIRYSIKPVYIDSKLIDILLVPAAEGEFATIGAGVPQELEEDSYKILAEFFAAIPEMKEQGISRALSIPGFRELLIKLTDFDIENIPQSMWNLAPKLLEMVYSDYMKPLIKEINQFEDIMPEFGKMRPPMMPPMPFMPLPRIDKQAADFNASIMRIWDQSIDMQKSHIESTREQWDQLSDQYMEMEDNFADSLPEDLPLLPGFVPLPFSPKVMMKQWMKFEKMSKEHFMDQADSFAISYIRNQEKARDMAGSVYDKASNITKEYDVEEVPKSKSKATGTGKKTVKVKTVRARTVQRASKTKS